MTQPEEPYCCFVYPSGEKHCTMPAHVEIWSETGLPDDYTHSCITHIPVMLGTIAPDRPWGSYAWRIVPMPGYERKLIEE